MWNIIRRSPVIVAVAGLVLFIVLPLARLVTVESPGELARWAANAQLQRAIGLSLGAAAVTVLASGLLGTPLAYLLAYGRFPGKPLLEALVDLPLAVPHVVAGIALLLVFGRRGWVGAPAQTLLGVQFWDTAAGVVIAMLFVSAPYAVNAAREGFESVDPRLAKVARTLGASPWQVFRTVILPLAVRGVLTGLLLTFARALSEFGSVVILAYYPQSAPVFIYDLYQEYGLAGTAAAATIFLAVCLTIFVVFRVVAYRRPRAMREG